MQVATREGRYFVYEWRHFDLDWTWVERDKTCQACGKTNCEHVKAVAKFIRETGRRATGEEDKMFPLPPPKESLCPVCASKTELVRDYKAPSITWRCPGNPAHFWLSYRADEVRSFLTKPHFNKLVLWHYGDKLNRRYHANEPANEETSSGTGARDLGEREEHTDPACQGK